MGQLNRDWREAGDSLVSKRLRGAMLGLALGRKEGENLAGDGGVRFRRFNVAAWNDIQQQQQQQWCMPMMCVEFRSGEWLRRIKPTVA